MAVGHSILVIAWHLLTDDCDYADLGGDYFVRRDTDRQHQRAVAQLQPPRLPGHPPTPRRMTGDSPFRMKSQVQVLAGPPHQLRPAETLPVSYLGFAQVTPTVVSCMSRLPGRAVCRMKTSYLGTVSGHGRGGPASSSTCSGGRDSRVPREAPLFRPNCRVA
jgi:hypothetical protein